MSSTVGRAVEILELCGRSPRTAADLAAELGVHRTTVLRSLMVLQEAGFVRQTSPGVFGTGFRLAALARSAMDHFDLRGIAHAHLQKLSAEAGHTVQFAVLEGQRITYVDKIEPRDSIVLNTVIGDEVIVSTAGVAKAILAYLSASQRRPLLDRSTFTAHTERSITSRSEYERVLTKVQEQGWAFDDGEFDDLSNCIAAPVRDATEEVVGAVSITAFRSRTPLAALAEFRPQLLATTAAISEDLGWRP